MIDKLLFYISINFKIWNIVRRYFSSTEKFRNHSMPLILVLSLSLHLTQYWRIGCRFLDMRTLQGHIRKLFASPPRDINIYCRHFWKRSLPCMATASVFANYGERITNAFLHIFFLTLKFRAKNNTLSHIKFLCRNIDFPTHSIIDVFWRKRHVPY